MKRNITLTLSFSLEIILDYTVHGESRYNDCNRTNLFKILYKYMHSFSVRKDETFIILNSQLPLLFDAVCRIMDKSSDDEAHQSL